MYNDYIALVLGVIIIFACVAMLFIQIRRMIRMSESRRVYGYTDWLHEGRFKIQVDDGDEGYNWLD